MFRRAARSGRSGWGRKPHSPFVKEIIKEHVLLDQIITRKITFLFSFPADGLKQRKGTLNYDYEQSSIRYVIEHYKLTPDYVADHHTDPLVTRKRSAAHYRLLD